MKRYRLRLIPNHQRHVLFLALYYQLSQWLCQRQLLFLNAVWQVSGYIAAMHGISKIVQFCCAVIISSMSLFTCILDILTCFKHHIQLAIIIIMSHYLISQLSVNLVLNLNLFSKYKLWNSSAYKLHYYKFKYIYVICLTKISGLLCHVPYIFLIHLVK